MALRSVFRPDREEVEAENGIVAAMHPLAAEAGLEMLRKGGNAVDAAVATGFAISVVEPNNSCIAGVGFMLVHLASGAGEYPAGADVVVEYGPRSPLAARADMYRVTGPGSGISTYQTEGDENTHGYRSIAVPGTAAGLCRAHQLMGTLPLEQVMEPAIQYAHDGFESYWALTLVVAANMKQLQRFPVASDLFLPGGFPPGYLSDPSSADEGAYVVRQRDLADLLRRISKGGAAAMYEGEVAAAIEEDMKANGGLITRRDLAERKPEVRTPLRLPYRGRYEILSATAPNGAWTALQTMNILERFDLDSLDFGSAEHLHLFVEVARHAFADRYHYMADPEFVDVPLKGLLSKEYARELAGGIDMERGLLGERLRRGAMGLLRDAPAPRPLAVRGKAPPGCCSRTVARDRRRLHHPLRRSRPPRQPRLLYSDGGKQLRVQGDHEGARHTLEQRDDLVQRPAGDRQLHRAVETPPGQRGSPPRQEGRQALRQHRLSGRPQGQQCQHERRYPHARLRHGPSGGDHRAESRRQRPDHAGRLPRRSGDGRAAPPDGPQCGGRP